MTAIRARFSGLIATSCACLLAGAVSCKSAEENCALAQAAAEQAWQAQLTTLQKQSNDARETQANSETKLIKEIEPRLAQAAAQEASARYDRNSNAWMRAYQASQSSACARDAECARTRQSNAEAKEKQQDLAPKLSAVLAVLAAIRSPAEAAKQAVDAVVPEFGNAQIDAAKQLSARAYEACKNVRPKATSPGDQH
jgi:hypothetical protein